MNKQPTLADQVADAVKLRNKVQSIVKKNKFTTHELVNKSNLGHDQAKQMLIHLGKFAMLTTEVIDKKQTHRLIFDTKDRDAIIDAQIGRFTAQITMLDGSIQYLKALKETNPLPPMKTMTSFLGL